jgi:hypothetical protein
MTKSSKFQPSPYMREHNKWLIFAWNYQIKNFPGINPIFPVPANLLDEIKAAFALA